MVKVRWEPNRERAEIYFSGMFFHEHMEVCREHYFRWDKDYKCWWGAPNKVLQAVPEFHAVEKLVGDSNLEELRAVVAEMFKPELIHIRNKYDPTLERVHPIVGLPGKHANFQVDTVKQGITQNRLALFLQMGVGKTWCQIMTLNHFFKNNQVDRIFIICPVEAIYNWMVELLRFNTFCLTDEDF